MRKSCPALVLLGLLAAPRSAPAQGTPQGPEFRVNTYTTSSQTLPSVAVEAAGNWVAVWQSYLQDGSDDGIFAQRYSSAGAPLGGEFRVNSYTTSAQRLGVPAIDSAGNFVVVWMSYPPDGSDWGVFAQRYAATGAPLGGEFRVNSYTFSSQLTPAVASDPAGNFVVAWESVTQDGDSVGVFAQRFSATGAPAGGEFRVNTYTPNLQWTPSLAADAAGNLVVVWASYSQDGSFEGIYGQRYAAAGAPLGPEFRVNTYTTDNQRVPSVASDPAGNFVVVWASETQEGSGWGVFGQRFAAAGSALGGEFRVNSTTAFNQITPAVATDAAGNFVVTWASYFQGEFDVGVFGQRYAGTGAPLGGEFRVNTYTLGNQQRPAVAADPAGNFVVAWASYLQDESLNGVYAQRYSMIVPVELQGVGVE